MSTWSRRIVSVLLAAGILLTGMALAAPSSDALPTPCQVFGTCGKSWWDYIPVIGGINFDVCKTPPTPQAPGSGLSGWIDPGPATPDPGATSVYEVSEYPPPWSTYDLGCKATVVPTGATLDTTIGNWEMGAATSLVALCNSLHRMVSPPTFLAKLDPAVAAASAAIGSSTYTPYLDVSLLVLAVFLIMSARRRNLSSTVTSVAWAVLVMVIATQFLQYPVRSGHAVDAAATSVIGGINQQMLGEDPTAADPAGARAALLTDDVLYRQWLRGELGSSTSVVARKYGRLLLTTQTYSYAEVRQIQADPSTAAGITKTKAEDFSKLAQAVQAEDPSAYTALKGQASAGRIGAGGIALTSAFATAPFAVLADALIVTALFIIRFLVILFPAIAIFGLHYKARKIVIGVGSMGAAAVLNSVAACAIAALDFVIVGALLGTDLQLPAPVAILLCLVVQYVLWSLLRPFRRLTTMVSANGLLSSVDTPSGGKGLRKLLGQAGATALGIWGAKKIADVTDDGPDAPPEPAQQQRAPRPEAWTRVTVPEPAGPLPPWRQGELGYAPQMALPPAPDPVAPPLENEAPLFDPSGPTPLRSQVVRPGMPEQAYRQVRMTGISTVGVVDAPDGPASYSDGPAPEVLPADRPQPAPEPFRASPSVIDPTGRPVYRIWDPATRTAIPLPQEATRGDA